jgi:serine O-acetyltransferase
MTSVGLERFVLVLRALEWRHVRSVAYYRMTRAGGKDRLVSRILRIVLPGLSTLELNVNVLGAGLVIGHGYGSVIWADAIGEDCTIYQNVTVGQSHGKLPTLGHRVYVAPGAVILGPVTVGDDAIIGANAVVIRDVPQGATMVGVPASPLT